MVGPGAHRPDAHRGGLGQPLLGLRGQALPRLLQPARQRQHRPPAPEARRGDPGGRGPPVHHRPELRRRDALGGRAAHRRARARDLDKVFFTNGGAEATENAMRMARLHTGRHKVLATYRSYHGATAGSITRDRRPAPLGRTSPACPASSTSGARTPTARRSTRRPQAEEGERALQHLRDVDHGRGARRRSRRSCSRPSSGTNGILVPPDGYLAGVREICDEYGIVLIADEVMAGFGRCGEWFAVDHWGVVPDLICFAKGVNSGYVPLGGVVISEPIAATFDERVFPGGLTYSGHPLACASAVASITDLRGRGHHRERPQGVGDDRHRPRGWPRSPRSTRASARSAASASSGRSSSSGTARRASRSCPTTRAGPPPPR